jgi:hypothetical protein
MAGLNIYKETAGGGVYKYMRIYLYSAVSIRGCLGGLLEVKGFGKRNPAWPGAFDSALKRATPRQAD